MDIGAGNVSNVGAVRASTAADSLAALIAANENDNLL